MGFPYKSKKTVLFDKHRITKAKELLLMRRDRKIQEIAHDVGYTDSSHFTVMFKKLTGMTPAQFRRQ